MFLINGPSRDNHQFVDIQRVDQPLGVPTEIRTSLGNLSIEIADEAPTGQFYLLNYSTLLMIVRALTQWNRKIIKIFTKP